MNQHYKRGIETITILEQKLTEEEFKGFLKGNIIKYITRANYKGTEKQDYEKAKYYADLLTKI